jgi:peptide/nickel transport system substrate-binding protein
MTHGRSRRTGARIAAALLAVGSLALAACSSDDKGATDGTTGGTEAPSGTDAPGDTTATGDTTPTTDGGTGGDSDTALVIARQMDVNSLDPSLAYCDTCQIFMTAVYETLIGLDADNKTLVPRLATSWENNDAQTEFTFHLDPAATFADGTPVTSADVKFSWERLKGLQGSASYLVSSVETIDTPDPETVVVTLNAANSAFLAQVNASYLGIINSKVAQENGATLDPTTDKAEDWFLSNSAGSGPFSLESYTEGNELKFLRNDDYWGAKAHFPEVIIKETPDAVTQRQELEQGAVDIAMQISADVANGMSGDDITVTQVPSFNYVYIGLSPGAKGGEALKDPNVRKAIRLALDYPGLLDVTVAGAGHSQPSPIPNGFLGTDGLAEPKQDLDTAKQLMTDSGVGDITLDATFPSFNVYGVDFSTAMQKVQTDLKEIGITLELNPVEFSVWLSKITSDGIPVTAIYFAPDHTDSSQYVQYFGLIPNATWLGFSGEAENTEETDLLAQAFAANDDATRADLYGQLAQLMIDDQIVIPLVNPDLFLASRADIVGMHYSACCNLDLARLGKAE